MKKHFHFQAAIRRGPSSPLEWNDYTANTEAEATTWIKRTCHDIGTIGATTLGLSPTQKSGPLYSCTLECDVPFFAPVRLIGLTKEIEYADR